MYYEDFEPGETLRHHRGKTLTEMDQVLITNLVMNTAAGHFDEELMKDHMFGQRVAFGGVTIALVIGLAAQDTAENALAELSLDKIRLTQPVFHGDTLYAYTKVLGKEEADREDAGIVEFHHWGVNQDDKIVFEGGRRVLIKRRSHWTKK
ncbi:MAG: MaoC family dehydratase [Pseudomonadota bacterium]|nr:MaoC family dehydratase [Pseudomonadota bacterium]